MPPRTPSAISYDQLTKEQCEEWAANPTVNPVTKRKIKRDATDPRSIFVKLTVACEKYSIRVLDDPNVPAPAPTVKMTKEHQKLMLLITNGIRFPVTIEMWESRYKDIVEILGRMDRINSAYIMIEDSGVVATVLKYYQEAQRTHMLDLAMYNPRKQVQEFTSNFASIEKRLMHIVKNVPVKVPVFPQTSSDKVFKAFDDFIENGRDIQPQLVQIEADARAYADYYDTTGGRHILKQITDLQTIFHDIQLEKAEHQVITTDEHIPSSRLRSDPASLSASREDRMYSASYKRHSKFSRVSDFQHASPSKVAQLPQKTRQQILKELKDTCTIMKDTITYERFDRMNKKNLMLVVQLGKGEQNKHCFYVRNIYQVWKQAVKDNKPFVDPLNGVAVTSDEKDAIMQKMRYLKKDIKDPRDIAQHVPKAIKLYFKPVRHVDRNGVGHMFYEVQVRFNRNVGDYVYVVLRLGYIPAEIEPQDMGGSLNMSSAVLVSHLQQLFDTGRLLVENSAPYKCCRVHLRKPIEYWLDPSGPNGINKQRFAMMMEEIERYL